MGAIDPTYPLLPVMCIVASLLLLSLLSNSLARQNWNIGVALLCFWLLIDNIIHAVNAVAWSDNFRVKLYVYCDICEHSMDEMSCFTQASGNYSNPFNGYLQCGQTNGDISDISPFIQNRELAISGI